MACDSSKTDVGRNRPATIRAWTARVSRSAIAGSTAGLIGPWTVTIVLMIGWKMIGFDDHFVWGAPFGWYDRDV